MWLRKFPATRSLFVATLEKILDEAARVLNESAEMRPETALLFIVDPLSGCTTYSGFYAHPRTESHIAVLIELVRSVGLKLWG